VAESPRLALFPDGQPESSVDREKCTALLLSCGADLQRFIDGPWSSVETMLRYLGRIDDVASGRRPPFVVLTRINPLALTVPVMRRRLCDALVNLRRALWVIYVPDAEPFFFRNAASLGDFDLLGDSDPPGAESVRVWTLENGTNGRLPERYLVLTPRTVRDKYLHERVNTLWDEAEAYPLEPVTSRRISAVLPLPEQLRQFSRRRDS